MEKIGIWKKGQLLEHTDGTQTSSKIDVCHDFLRRKLCPLHMTPLILINEFTVPDGNYCRTYYKCMSCKCVAEFSGGKLHTSSVGKTMEYIQMMEADVLKFTEKNAAVHESSEGVKYI